MPYKYNPFTNEPDYYETSTATGDVTGPGSSTTNDIVVFADNTGKVIADSGFSISSIISPSTVNYSTDFIDRRTEFSTDGTGGSSAIGFSTSAANPGQVQLQVSGGAASAGVQLQNFCILGAGSITYDNVYQIETLGSASNRISLQAGLMDQFGGLENGNPNNGIYFQYKDDLNSGQWQCITRSGGVSTTSNTSVTADTNFHKYRIVINAAGTSVNFYIDGVLVATNTTNIPSVAMGVALALSIGAATGALMNVNWDYLNFVQTLTTPR